MKSHRKHAPETEEKVEKRTSVNRNAYPKSKKQRLDQLKQATKDLFREMEYDNDIRAREQKCRLAGHPKRWGHCSCDDSWWKEWHKKDLRRYRDQYDRLWAAAKKDGII